MPGAPAGIATADRSLASAEATFRRIASMPGSGTPYGAEYRAFGELRLTPLPSRFKNYLAFYRPVEGGVAIIRVLHGARDLHSLLAEEFGADDDGDEAGE